MAIIMEWNAHPGSAGPPLEMRISEDQARSLALNMGFRFQESLPVDAFHYTLSFKK